MAFVILLFATIITVLGFSLIVQPRWLMGYMVANQDHSGLYALAIGSRLILGSALVLHAAASPFPLVVQILGWLALVAGVGLAAMGKTRFRGIISRVANIPPAGLRPAGFLATAFGVFLIYLALW